MNEKSIEESLLECDIEEGWEVAKKARQSIKDKKYNLIGMYISHLKRCIEYAERRLAKLSPPAKEEV